MNKIEVQRKKRRRKELLLYFLTVLFSVSLLIWGHKVVTKDLTIFNNSDIDQEIYKAKVVKILDRVVDEYSYDENTTEKNVWISFEAELLSGENKGDSVKAVQSIDSSLPFNGTVEIKEGDKILLIYTSIEGMEEIIEQEFQFMEFVRTDKLLILGVLFILFLLLFGHKKGVNTLLSLGFTCVAVFAVFIPAILSGKNIYVSSILICVYTIIMTYLIINGYNRKTFAACLGCLGGIALSGLLTVIMDKILVLTGILSEESIYLTYLPTEVSMDLKAIIFAAIIIGAMGAIMDVAMSISSSLWEVKDTAEAASFDMLLRSGMNIGRDIMGTMANTLILAYIGSSLSVILLLTVYSTSLLYLLNLEMIIVEILQALVGSFGILLTIPLTSFICSIIYTKIRRNRY